MKKIIILIVIGATTTFGFLLLNGCAASQEATNKTGAQLWGEHCMRCHDAPSPADYSDAQWDAVGLHMKVRANNFTDAEMTKIVDFLKSAN